jgi:hypothetical protein
MINPFSNEVNNAGNCETGVYQQPCNFIEECGSQMDALRAIKHGKEHGITREKAVEKFNKDQILIFEKRLKAGQVGIKKKRGTDLDNENLEYRYL